LIKDHVLLSKATQLKEVANELKTILTDELITTIINSIPEDWLRNESDTITTDRMRANYLTYLQAKLALMESLVKEADDAK